MNGTFDAITDEGVTMTRRHARWLCALAFGFVPASAFGQSGKVLPPPTSNDPAAVLVPPAAPFGYYATKWRAFPTPTPPAKAPAPVSTPLLQAPKPLPRTFADSAPPLAVSREMTARRIDEPIPPPRPAIRPVAAPEPLKVVAGSTSGGFATLRPTSEPPTSLPAAATVVRTPIVDPKVKTASFQDDVLRPAWPVITDPPVKK
jgi:hypothetical protein